MQDLLEAAGVEPVLAGRLARYGMLLLEANRRVNLSGAESPEALLPHLIDALTLVPYVRGPLIDIGSGGGLPAIPLALALDVPVTLIESVGKKAAFLRGAAEALDVQAQVIARRAEEAAHEPDLRERFLTGTARAVSTAPTVIELVMPFLAIGGAALLQRGLMDERERNAASDAAPMLGGNVADEVRLGNERRILIVRKEASTPDRFPRRNGVPEKRPLCL